MGSAVSGTGHFWALPVSETERGVRTELLRYTGNAIRRGWFFLSRGDVHASTNQYVWPDQCHLITKILGHISCCYCVLNQFWETLIECAIERSRIVESLSGMFESKTYRNSSEKLLNLQISVSCSHSAVSPQPSPADEHRDYMDDTRMVGSQMASVSAEQVSRIWGETQRRFQGHTQDEQSATCQLTSPSRDRGHQ